MTLVDFDQHISPRASFSFKIHRIFINRDRVSLYIVVEFHRQGHTRYIRL